MVYIMFIDLLCMVLVLFRVVMNRKRRSERRSDKEARNEAPIDPTQMYGMMRDMMQMMQVTQQ